MHKYLENGTRYDQSLTQEYILFYGRIKDH